MKKCLVALAFGTLGLGMSEFGMMGILTFVASGLHVSIPQAGHLVSAYALGVCVGAPLTVAVAHTRPLKQILLALAGLMVAGNLCAAFAPNYGVLLAVSILCCTPFIEKIWNLLKKNAVTRCAAILALLVVSTVEEATVTREIAPALETQDDDTMFLGQQRVIQEGQAGQANVLSRVVKRCGIPVASNDLNAVTVTEATPLIVGTGTKAMPELPDGCLFLWPVQGTITSEFGYRYIFGETNFHRGLDIAAPEGTAINAAADGTVTFAGERGTYGNLVKLDHGNGFVTYYAHCSQLLVQEGDTVDQGETIALVGSTGRSTGPHCHFEVLWQGELLDPLACLPDSPGGSTIP